MEKKVYSTASHLIHSRMQLIRHKVEIVEHMQIAMLVYQNKQYFDAAAESVLKQHDITSEYRDIFDAADLFYKSTFPPPGKNDIRYYTVQYFYDPTKQWIDIKWWDKENDFVLADPDERLDHGQALQRLASMNVGKLLIFRITTKYAVSK